MAQSTVGGRPFGFSKAQIERLMKGVEPEPIQTHYVQVNDITYPPKQVLAVITGWDRNTYTSQEANRVLKRAGLTAINPIYLKDKTPSQLQAERRNDLIRDTIADLKKAIARLELALR